MHDTLAQAVRLVREGGEMARAMIRRAGVLGDKGGGDFVTDADLKVEAHILSALKAAYPEHGYFSEEAGGEATDRDFVWVLDPIDGTRHYVRGNPLYAVSLALTRRGVPVLGAVYLPETDQCFAAARGEGATLNGVRLRCAVPPPLERAMGCLEVPSRNVPDVARDRAARQLLLLMGRARRVRILGVSSIGLCMTAAGHFDVYVNLGSNWRPHDVAAARVVMTEAGGAYHAFGRCLVAGHSGLCTAVLEYLDFEEA